MIIRNAATMRTRCFREKTMIEFMPPLSRTGRGTER
jgi:hypothetical protein